MLLFAVFAAAIEFALMFFLLGRVGLRLGEAGFALACAVPALILLGGFVIEAWLHKRRHGVMQVHGVRLTYVDHKSSLDSPNERGLAIERAALFPAWLFFSALGSCAAALRLARARHAVCAELLAHLAAEDRRVFIPQIEDRFGPEIVPAMQALLAFPGVLISSREAPALLLGSELDEGIKGML
jgi:hypothetical protein